MEAVILLHRRLGEAAAAGVGLSRWRLLGVAEAAKVQSLRRLAMAVEVAVVALMTLQPVVPVEQAVVEEEVPKALQGHLAQAARWLEAEAAA